jgi:alpha 1,3-glucosidase
VLNLIGSDTYVDVLHDKAGTHTHWVSESGILDILLLPGPRPQQLFEQYALLAGPTALPPQWSTAYHQCRWNYINEDDVLEVDRRFDESDIPLDVTWLDVEYTVERRYFDWNKGFFPDVKRMLSKVAEKGRKVSHMSCLTRHLLYAVWSADGRWSRSSTRTSRRPTTTASIPTQKTSTS